VRKIQLLNSQRLKHYLSLSSLRGLNTALALLKDILLTRLFGLGAFLDGYFICLSLVDMFGGYFQQMGYSVLVPLYNDSRQRKEPDSDQEKIIKTFIIYVGLTVFIIALLVVLGSSYIGYLFSPSLMDGNSDFKLLLGTLLPLGIILQGSFALRLLLLQHRRFNLHQWPVILSSVLYIAILLLTYTRWHIWSVIVAYLLSQLVQLILYFQLLAIDFNFLFSKIVFNKMFRLMMPVTGIVVTYYLLIPVDNFFLAQLPIGELSAYRYASKLVTTLSTLTVFSLQMTLIPRLMEYGSGKNYAELKKILQKGILESVLFSIPIVLLGYFLAPWLISLLFERGKFTVNDTYMMTSCFQVLILQLPYIGGWMLISRIFNSLYWSKSFLLLGVLILILRIILDMVGVCWNGLNGVVWSTTIHYYVMIVLGFLFVRFKLNRLSTQLT